MKITFVGTSHGAPSAERSCSCTMIESGGSVYFIDAGAPVIDNLLRMGKSVESLRAVFLTHTHSDHAVGMVNLAGLINWYYHKAAADFYVPEENLIEATKNWLIAAGDGEIEADRVRFKVPTEGVVYEDENIKVEYIKTGHSSKIRSYAILVTEGNTRVLFGGDFSQDLKRADVPEIIKEELDGFVCEMAHFKLPQLASYLETCRAKKVFFTHVFPLDNYNDIERAKSDYCFEIFAPSDSDVFVI